METQGFVALLKIMKERDRDGKGRLPREGGKRPCVLVWALVVCLLRFGLDYLMTLAVVRVPSL